MPSRPSMLRHVVAALALAIVASGACADAATDLTEPSTAPSLDVGGVPRPDASAALTAVLAGNAQALAVAPTLPLPGAPLTPFSEARLYAIVNVAMHDALNAIVPRFERYADGGPVDGDAAIAAAVLTAARDAIIGAAPAARSAVEAWYGRAIAAYSSAPGFGAGIAVGQRAAAAILARRANDGTAGGGVAPYTPGSSPGDYRFTFPFDTPAFDLFGTGGFADASQWGATVTPFVVRGTAHFRAPPPYGTVSNAAAVQTPQYTADLNEVKVLGCVACPSRTAEQTEIALFWVESSPAAWNRITRTVIEQRQLDAWDAARLLALLQIGEFDTYATNLESKYHYGFWRPVTAVAMADADGNPDTSPAGDWQVPAFPTPPVPDYPSAHAAAGGAAAAIIEALVPGRGRAIAATSASLPGVTRTYATVADAAAENALSRIYVGYHFRHAVEVGLSQGEAIGAYIAARALVRVR